MIRRIPYIITGCFSAALFYIFYGFRVLNPLYVDWLLSEGDPGQHYLGWALYRNSPFRFNFGLTNNLAYPYTTSVIFTDSIPLMAVPCKIIGRFTRAQFQYFGIWGLLCIILTSVLTCFLLSRYIKHPLILTLSSILVTISPCMLRRIFWHTALGSHFVIILGLILISRRKQLCDTVKHTVLWWAFISLISCSIHMYFLAMNTILLLGFICFRFVDLIGSTHLKTDDPSVPDTADHVRTELLSCLFAVVSYILTAFVSVWLLGGFSSGMANAAPGLEYYSFNLNGFFNPQGWSAFLHDLPLYKDGQYEGFAYLGAGMIIALIISLITGISRYIKNRPSTRIAYVKVICGLMIFLITILVSASNEISLGTSLLLRIELPEKLSDIWSIFRACGRLIWPAVYIICIVSMSVLSRSLKNVFTSILLILCIFLQLFDLRYIAVKKHLEFDREYVYEYRLNGDIISDITWKRNLKHIVFLDKENLSQEELYAFAEYAARKNLTINDFYFARCMEYPAGDTALDFFKHPSEDTLYVITDESYEMRYMFDLNYYKYGDLSLGLKSPL